MRAPTTTAIIGAGPAGLTAAYELLSRSKSHRVVVLEESHAIGGIARTVVHNGLRMDIGGHRLFTKIPEVDAWWNRMLPRQGAPALDDKILGRPCALAEGGPDPDFTRMGVREMVSLGLIASEANVLDTHVERIRKAYPAYFDTYAEFPALREWLDTIPNLYCVGRNGQHRYNNIDHCQCTAFEAVRAILAGSSDRTSVWNVNTEKEYHEIIGRDTTARLWR